MGLYHGSNMSLLKTVFDVHLQLFFGGGKTANGSDAAIAAGGGGEANVMPLAKTTILFVVRDFLGGTPAANLQSILLTDMQRIWESLQRPERLKAVPITGLFRFEFAFLPHRILRPAEFAQCATELGERFQVARPGDGGFGLFEPSSAKRVPIDGLARYGQSIWERIMANKDLDLPTQQELLAQYRCDEISTVIAVFAISLICSQTFYEEFLGGCADGDLGQLRGRDFGNTSASLRDECLAAFTRDASRYSRPVFQRKMTELAEKIETHLLATYRQVLKVIFKDALQVFGQSIQGCNSASFSSTLRTAYVKCLEHFETESLQSVPPGYRWEQWWSAAKLELEGELDALAAQARQSELAKREAQLIGQFRKRLTAVIGLLFVEPADGIWEAVWLKYQGLLGDHLEAIRRVHAELELSENGGKEVLQEGLLRASTYAILIERLKEETSDTLIQVHLKRRFDSIFKHDKQGIPRIWEPSDDIGRIFEEAKASASQLLDRLTVFDGGEEQPVELVDAARRERILGMISRDFDLAYVDAKRSIMRISSTIPWWIYLVILILGWNEIMAVLRSPLLLLLLVLVVAGTVVVHLLGACSFVWMFWHRALTVVMQWAMQFSDSARSQQVRENHHSKAD